MVKSHGVNAGVRTERVGMSADAARMSACATIMKLAFLCFGCFIAVAAPPGENIRTIDFANHEYPWRASDSWPHELEWLRASEPNRIQLVNGRWKMHDYDFKQPFSGLTLEEVVYGDLTGDSKDEAVAVVRYDSGGTQYYYWVYIYSADANGPKLLAYFRTGDRAAQGLYRVYLRNGKLVVELYDPEKQEGDCCSSGLLRQQYRWDGQAFHTVGPMTRGRARHESRRRVSTFGLPNGR
jgi:hypothetical protein